MEIACNSCGATNWNDVYETGYPERRNERDQTVKTIYKCENCGAEARHFEHKAGGPDTYSGAFR
jgi:uncharacterized Zn finger protein